MSGKSFVQGLGWSGGINLQSSKNQCNEYKICAQSIIPSLVSKRNTTIGQGMKASQET
jgi:hypothetical protein